MKNSGKNINKGLSTGLMAGIAPLILIIIATAIIAAAGGGFIFVSKRKAVVPVEVLQTYEQPAVIEEMGKEHAKIEAVSEKITELSPTTPSVLQETRLEKPEQTQPVSGQVPALETDQSELTGPWKVEKAYAVSPAGEFKEVPVPFPLYSEFKNGFICLNWDLGEVYKCKEYEKINIKGNRIEVISSAGKIRAIFQWGIGNGKLEFIQLVDGKPKSKTISTRASRLESSITSPSAPVPKETSAIPGSLLGGWRLDRVLGFDPATEQWKEGAGTGVKYQEFTNNFLCLGYQMLIGASPEVYKCSNYAPYAVTGDIIEYGAYDIFSKQETKAYYRWNISNGKLELSVGIGDKPFLKYVYNKIPPPSPPLEPFILIADKTSERIGAFGASFMISSAVKTTDTIHFWITDSLGRKISMSSSIISCEPAKICASLSGMTLNPAPENQQCPFSVTKAADKYGREIRLSDVLCFVPWGYKADGTTGPNFSLQVLANEADSYTLHAKLLSSGLEAILPIQVTN